MKACDTKYLVLVNLLDQSFFAITQNLPLIFRTYTDVYAHCCVAKGQYVGKVDIAGALWDIFPSFLLIREAGGHVRFYPAERPTTDLYGSLVVGTHQFVETFHSHLPAGTVSYENIIPQLDVNVEKSTNE